jgi:hypothetical protein
MATPAPVAELGSGVCAPPPPVDRLGLPPAPPAPARLDDPAWFDFSSAVSTLFVLESLESLDFEQAL